MDRLLGHHAGAGESFAAASIEDDDFALPYAARAYLAWAQGDPSTAGSLADAALARTPGASERERGHVDVVSARVRGGPVDGQIRAHVESFPTDALILRLAYF